MWDWGNVCCVDSAPLSGHFHCSLSRFHASLNQECCCCCCCCWPSEGCYYYSDSSGSSCSTMTGYWTRSNGGMEGHWVQEFALSRPMWVRRDTVDREEVSAMRLLLLAGSIDQQRMAVLPEVLVLRDTAIHQDKQGLRTIVGRRHSFQPQPITPDQLLFDASIWFCEEEEEKKNGEFGLEFGCNCNWKSLSVELKGYGSRRVTNSPLNSFHLQNTV